MMTTFESDSYINVANVWRKWGTPHYRHTHATLMLRQGIHPKIVSERLGHSTIGITLDTYTHVLPNLQREATEQFERLFLDNEKRRKNKRVTNL